MEIRPRKIFYNHDSISNTFGRGRHRGMHIGELLDDLITGDVTVDDIPPITVMRKNGRWYTCDNRRLWVFKKAEKLGVLRTIHVEEGYIPPENFTTENGGVHVHIRGSPEGFLWRIRNMNLYDN